MEPSKEILEVSNLSLSYEDESILKNISFSLDKGEKLLLLGPSGSGKSSLTLCLNGLIPRSIEGNRTGTICFRGKEIEAYAAGELSRHIGVVFQDPESQFCMLTVEDEIAFGLENINIPREEMVKKIDRSLSLVGLEKYKYAQISTLSGGMKQKLALACVIAMEPEILILDEPTALLDPAATKEFVQTIDSLQKKLDFSLIVIEHKLDYWIPYLDRCLVLTQTGNLMYDGLLKEGLVNHFEEMKELGLCLPKVTIFGQQFKADFFSFTLDELVKELDEKYVQNLFMPTISSPSKTLIEMKNVSFLRGSEPILKNIDLTIGKGQWTAIIGPNGAGKSTLSLLLAGLFTAKHGEIIFENKLLKDLSELEKRNSIGYVFQNPEHQFITDTVFDEVAFGLKMKKTGYKDIETKVENVLSACRLTELKNNNPFSLSQGQKRRLSVATMLIDDQDLLILDEPTFGQDGKATDELMKLVEDRVKSGMTALMVTHDMELVANYAHQVIVLSNGEVSFQGTPHDLFSMHTEQIEKANLELPLRYAVVKQWRNRGELVATSVVKS
ncbi:ABC transporter ATP-binding protein [Heyndrickxia sp. NPDC080065]|uniref:ABC transporter ATP-binding protein n=1 Tax=Heyndrickxia sp. NPDC080065 TaxID=3390568 RepID=UPI003D03DEE0